MKMESLIADAAGKGARLVAGGALSGSVVAATVLYGVKPVRDEAQMLFGGVKGSGYGCFGGNDRF